MLLCEELLTPRTHSLQQLTLLRLRGDRSGGTLTLEQCLADPDAPGEVCLYPLTGQVRLECPVSSSSVVFGGRASILVPDICTFRMQYRPGPSRTCLAVRALTETCDALLVTCPNTALVLPWDVEGPHRAFYRQVGEGTHRREVREMPPPAGAHLHLGETLNIPGGLSSWPPHASTEDRARYALGKTTHEEVMFFICQQPGIAVLDGQLSTGDSVNQLVRIENGSAHVMPLGSHTLYAAPDSFLWYFWAYAGTALTKEYNQWATDVGTYRK